jgi:hypothetical protein
MGDAFFSFFKNSVISFALALGSRFSIYDVFALILLLILFIFGSEADGWYLGL